MKRIIYFIIRNLIHIIGVILVSIFFVFLIFPTFISLELLKTFLSETKKEPFIAITVAILFLIIYCWKGTYKLWKRYKNTFALEKPPFTYLDWIFLFFVSSIFLIAIFQNNFIQNLSSEFKLFINVNFILVAGWFLTIYFWKERKINQDFSDIDNYTLSDEPIQSFSQDLLGRKDFIEDIYNEITNLPFHDSFVFGLCGSWGEGKTSIINLLKNKFHENSNFLIADFDPWHFKDMEAIITAFYRNLEEVISQKFIFPSFKKILLKYQKIISAGISHAGIKIDFFFNEESLEKIKNKIESFIYLTQKRILIVIDNIDRLQPKEILLVFKLVRLSANFRNTVFVLGFDPTKIQDYLKKHIDTDPEFLEKIIQQPISLPAIEQRDIDRFLDFHVDKLFSEIEISKENIEKFEKDFPDIYQTQVIKLFKTLRHAKRYLNGLRSTLPAIKNEINLYDFLILEVIRIFYPKIFDDIWKNPWFYIPLDWSDATRFLSPFSFALNEDDKYLQIKEHIENVIANEKEKEVLRNLLEKIFFVEVKSALSLSRTNYSNVVKSYRVEKRITHPECFRKYFMLKVPTLELSDEFIETSLNLWHSLAKVKRGETIEKKIFEIQEKGILLDFLKKLLMFLDKIQIEIVPDIVKVLYRNANRFSKKGTENLWNSEYDKSSSLLLWLINDKTDKSKIHNLLEEIVTNTPNLHFAALIILSCRKEQGGELFNIYDSIRIEDLQKKVADRLKRYFIDENRDIFDVFPEERDWSFIIYQWATNWMTFKGDNNKVVSNYILSIIKNDVKKFIKFLMQKRQKTFSDIWTFNLNEIAQVYDLTELKVLAEKFKSDMSLSEEGKDSIEMFLKLYENKKTEERKNQ